MSFLLFKWHFRARHLASLLALCTLCYSVSEAALIWSAQQWTEEPSALSCAGRLRSGSAKLSCGGCWSSGCFPFCSFNAVSFRELDCSILVCTDAKKSFVRCAYCSHHNTDMIIRMERDKSCLQSSFTRNYCTYGVHKNSSKAMRRTGWFFTTKSIGHMLSHQQD